jgi:DNA-binding GntR family transcriptional regulator
MTFRKCLPSIPAFLIPDPPALRAAQLPRVNGQSPIDCDHGQRRAAIVEGLLHDIFHGKLRAGQHLVTRELAERFGVSHTPIREALIALAGIGVIDLLPNRGAVARRVTPEEVREICHVRRALECEAVRGACGQITTTILESLRKDLLDLIAAKDILSSRFIDQARDIDSRLHDAIAASCGNNFLAKELGRLKMLFRAFRDLSWKHDKSKNDFHRLGEEADQHLAIVEALIAQDRSAATQAMSRHILSGRKYWSRSMPETPPETKRSRRSVRAIPGSPS